MGGERGTNIKIDEFGGSRGSVRSPSYKFVSRFASAMKKRGKRGQRVVVLPFFAPPSPPFLLCSRGIGGKSACLDKGERGGRGVESRANRNDFETSRSNPFALNEGGIRGIRGNGTTTGGEEGERTVHSYTVIDRSYPCFRFVNSNWLDRGIDEFGMR